MLACLQYFTRLRVPASVGHSPLALSECARYLPLVGGVVGCAGAAVFLLADYLLPQGVAVLISVAAMTWLTGALHEDGLADAIDGLGGGETRERILEIMRDPRVGTYGATALVLTFAIRIASLGHLPAAQVPVALVAGHAVSRAGAVAVMVSLPYVRERHSRASALTQALSATSIWSAMATAAAVTIVAWILGLAGAWLAVIAAAVTTLWWRTQIARQLGGHTGDCLGATQQLSETAFYVCALATCST